MTFFFRDESETGISWERGRSKMQSREETGFVLIKEEKSVGGGGLMTDCQEI